MKLSTMREVTTPDESYEDDYYDESDDYDNDGRYNEYQGRR